MPFLPATPRACFCATKITCSRLQNSICWSATADTRAEGEAAGGLATVTRLGDGARAVRSDPFNVRRPREQVPNEGDATSCANKKVFHDTNETRTVRLSWRQLRTQAALQGRGEDDVVLRQMSSKVLPGPRCPRS